MARFASSCGKYNSTYYIRTETSSSTTIPTKYVHPHINIVQTVLGQGYFLRTVQIFICPCVVEEDAITGIKEFTEKNANPLQTVSKMLNIIWFKAHLALKFFDSFRFAVLEPGNGFKLRGHTRTSPSVKCYLFWHRRFRSLSFYLSCKDPLRLTNDLTPTPWPESHVRLVGNIFGTLDLNFWLFFFWSNSTYRFKT